jgi:hypothetical protein
MTSMNTPGDAYPVLEAPLFDTVSFDMFTVETEADRRSGCKPCSGGALTLVNLQFLNSQEKDTTGDGGEQLRSGYSSTSSPSAAASAGAAAAVPTGAAVDTVDPHSVGGLALVQGLSMRTGHGIGHHATPPPSWELGTWGDLQFPSLTTNATTAPAAGIETRTTRAMRTEVLGATPIVHARHGHGCACTSAVACCVLFFATVNSTTSPPLPSL